MKKRLSLILAGVCLFGCAPKNEPAPASTISGEAPSAFAPVASESTAPKIETPAAPATPVVPATPAPTVTHAATPPTVYEMNKDGKIYVFATVEALVAFQGGKEQPLVQEKPELNPGHFPVVIEGADEAQAASIVAGYQKLHPTAK